MDGDSDSDGLGDRAAIGWLGLVAAAGAGIPASLLGSTFANDVLSGSRAVGYRTAWLVVALGIASGLGAVLVEAGGTATRVPRLVGWILGGLALPPALVLAVVVAPQQPLAAVVALLPFAVAGGVALLLRLPRPIAYLTAPLVAVATWVVVIGAIAGSRN
jgi:hypothetical protein